MLSAQTIPRRSPLYLPSDVRYALRYRGAALGLEEILALANNRFENEAAYLLLKIAVDEPVLQLVLLQSFVDSVAGIPNTEPFTNEETREAVRGFVVANATRVCGTKTVAGAKLAQISRQGFDHWDGIYRRSAADLARDPRDSYVIGHSTFIGLAGYVQWHNLTGKELRLLIPPFVISQTTTHCGYSVHGDVRQLPKNFARTSSAVLVDDTKHTGACERRMLSLWTNGDDSLAPKFEFFTIVGENAVCGS